MAKSQAKTQIFENYYWPKPELSAFARLSALVSPAFFGTDQVFRGTVTLPGSPSVKNIFELADEWTAALSSGVTSAELEVRSSDYLQSLNVTANPSENRLQLRMTVPINSTEQARAFTKAIEDELDLKPESITRHRRSIDFGSSYRVAKPETSAAFLTQFDALIARLGPVESSNARFRLISAPQYEYSWTNIDDWQKALAEAWNDLSEAGCWFNSRDGTTYLRWTYLQWNFDRSEASIKVQSSDQEKLRATVDAIEAEFGFSALVGKALEPAKAGTIRQYFTKSQIDEAWFVRAVELFRGLTKAHPYFSGRIFADSIAYPSLITGNLDEWKTEVTARWERVQRFVCWQSTADFETNFDCDPRREIVLLQVQARAPGEAARVLQSFESELELEPAPDKPYRYRRFMRSYEILPGMANTALADAIEAAIALAFPQKKPAVADAYLTEDRESADLMPVGTIEKVVETLRQQQNLSAK
jgi:hypothetical protein